MQIALYGGIPCSLKRLRIAREEFSAHDKA